jgi:hypothetical protein
VLVRVWEPAEKLVDELGKPLELDKLVAEEDSPELELST